MENCGFRTHLMVIYLSFDRALNNKFREEVFWLPICPRYVSCLFLWLPILMCVVSRDWGRSCLLCSLLTQLGDWPVSESQSSFSLSILILWSPGPPCLSSHSDSQLQVYNVKRGTQKTDLIRILSDVLSACEGLSYKNWFWWTAL